MQINLNSLINTYAEPIRQIIRAHASTIITVAAVAISTFAIALLRHYHSQHSVPKAKKKDSSTDPKTAEAFKNMQKPTTPPLDHMTKNRAAIPTGKRRPPTRKAPNA